MQAQRGSRVIGPPIRKLSAEWDWANLLSGKIPNTYCTAVTRSLVKRVTGLWSEWSRNRVLIPRISKGFPFSSTETGSETRPSSYLMGSFGQFAGPSSWPLTAIFRMVDVRCASTSTTRMHLNGVVFTERTDSCTLIFTCCCACKWNLTEGIKFVRFSKLVEMLSGLGNLTTEMAVGCNPRQIWLWNADDVFERITEGWCRHEGNSDRWNGEPEVTGRKEVAMPGLFAWPPAFEVWMRWWGGGVGFHRELSKNGRKVGEKGNAWKK